jgi:hypothetical protein
MMHDKAFWRSIAQNHYMLPPGMNSSDFTPQLLLWLGNPDPELRDEIAVETLTNWILGSYYSPEALRDMLAKLTSNLTSGLGEVGTNSVLVRSFSALILSIIAYHDWKNPFLDAEEVHRLLQNALDYFTAEKDVRGYDAQLGWLHSPAHTADLLKFLSRSQHVNTSDHQRIVLAVAAKVSEPRSLVFVNSEYERLAWVILDVVRREMLQPADWKAWLDQLKLVKQRDTGRYDADYHGAYQNTKHFLRSVYFLLAYLEEPLKGSEAFKAEIFQALRLFML